MTKPLCQVCDAPTDGFLCNAHADELSAYLAEIPDLLADLLISETKQARVYRATGRGEAEAPPRDLEAGIPARLRSSYSVSALAATPLPMNEKAREVADKVNVTVLTWAAHIAETRGVRYELPASEWLRKNVASIQQDEAAGELHRKIIAVYSEGDRLIDRIPSRRWYGPCQAIVAEAALCERDLYARPGAAVIRCDGYRGERDDAGCGTEHTREERDEWLQRNVATSVLTVRAVLASLPMDQRPKRSQVDAWIRRGRLDVIGTERTTGEPLVRGWELLSIVASVKPRRNRLAS
jgi:hypothetical protein